jgi:hypothetical protein
MIKRAVRSGAARNLREIHTIEKTIVADIPFCRRLGTNSQRLPQTPAQQIEITAPEIE